MSARPRTIGERLARAAEASFVGRERELSELRKAIDAPDPPFVVAFLHGPGGIGKSALLRAVCRGPSPDVRALVLDCRDVEPTPEGFLAAMAGALGLPAGARDLGGIVTRLTAGVRRAVLALDTYETFGLLDTWLREVFVPGLPDNVLILIAGREAPNSAWTATPGWHGLARIIELRDLAEDDARAMLSARGLDVSEIERVRRFARGYPIALELAAAAVRSRPDLDFVDVPPTKVLEQLTAAFIAGLSAEATRFVEAASTVRRVTEPLLAAMLDAPVTPGDFRRLGELPFVDATTEGFILHDVVRETIAAELARRAPERHRAYRRRAWRLIAAESRNAMRRQLWQCTADMLHLIENPAVRNAFFPDGASAHLVGPATLADENAILAIAIQTEPVEAARWIERWWRRHPETFSVAKLRDGSVVAFFAIFEPERVDVALLHADPLTAAWERHLREHPVASGERVLFLRRWLATGTGEAPSAAQAACWLDIKRTYMEFRPSLRRLYTAVTGLATYAPIVLPLRFAPVPDSNVVVDGSTYHTAVLDFGPDSVDGWLAALVGAELGVDEPAISAPRGRQLVTVLFTAIVGATERTVALGDARWGDLLERHHALVRAELLRHRGREVDTAGDGFFAAFDTPVDAIRCALAAAEALRPLGLTIRAGIHTGECEAIGDKLGGVAVHIGARVAARAQADEVWVSNTVKDLVAGSGLAFAERGAYPLKGIPGEWRLYAARS